jgi:cytochrome P450
VPIASSALAQTPDTLELLARAPDPRSAARLTKAQITAVLKKAGRSAGPMSWLRRYALRSCPSRRS